MYGKHMSEKVQFTSVAVLCWKPVSNPERLFGCLMKLLNTVFRQLSLRGLTELVNRLYKFV